MSIVTFVIGVVVGFIVGILVGRNNKNKVEKVVQQAENLKNKF